MSANSYYPIPCLGNLVADSSNNGGPGGSVLITNSSYSTQLNTSASLGFKVARIYTISGEVHDLSGNYKGNVTGNSKTWSGSYIDSGYYNGTTDYSDVRITAVIDVAGPPTGVACVFNVTGNTLNKSREAMRIASSGNVFINGNLIVNNRIGIGATNQFYNLSTDLSLGSDTNNIKIAIYDDGTPSQLNLYGIGYNNNCLTFVTNKNAGSTFNTTFIDMVLDINGNLGINTVNPVYRLDVNGDIRATGQIIGQLFNATSDYRVKTNIVPLTGNAYSVDFLNPIKYTNINLNKEDMGFLAHEIQEIFPFLVNGVKDGKDMQSLNYTGLIALLVKEIKDIKSRLSTVENKLM